MCECVNIDGDTIHPQFTFRMYPGFILIQYETQRNNLHTRFLVAGGRQHRKAAVWGNIQKEQECGSLNNSL